MVELPGPCEYRGEAERLGGCIGELAFQFGDAGRRVVGLAEFGLRRRLEGQAIGALRQSGVRAPQHIERIAIAPGEEVILEAMDGIERR